MKVEFNTTTLTPFIYIIQHITTAQGINIENQYFYSPNTNRIHKLKIMFLAWYKHIQNSDFKIQNKDDVIGQCNVVDIVGKIFPSKFADRNK